MAHTIGVGQLLVRRSQFVTQNRKLLRLLVRGINVVAAKQRPEGSGVFRPNGLPLPVRNIG